MAKSNEIRIILRADKKAVKAAIETATRTGISLVSCEGSTVKIVKPNVRYRGLFISKKQVFIE